MASQIKCTVNVIALFFYVFQECLSTTSLKRVKERGLYPRFCCQLNVKQNSPRIAEISQPKSSHFEGSRVYSEFQVCRLYLYQ